MNSPKLNVCSNIECQAHITTSAGNDCCCHSCSSSGTAEPRAAHLALQVLHCAHHDCGCTAADGWAHCSNTTAGGEG